MSDVTVAVLSQWEKANPLFKPPIICLPRSMEQRLTKEWERARKAAQQIKNLCTELRKEILQESKKYDKKKETYWIKRSQPVSTMKKQF